MLGLYEKNYKDFSKIQEKSERIFFGVKRFILEHEFFFGDKK